MSNSTRLSKLTETTDEKSVEVMKTVNALVDAQSFVESDKFILSETSLGNAVGEGVVSGFALIGDVQTAVFATNPAVLKGSIGAANANKIVRCIQKALETESPIVGIFDTAGARFSEGIEAMEGYSRIINGFSRAYGTVPVICVVKGCDYGLSSYLSAICDLCVAYDKASLATSSPLILAAGTKSDPAKVGTTAIHTAQSGIVSAVVQNDAELRKVVGNYLDLLTNPVSDCKDDENRVCPKLKSGSKVADVIAEAFDKGSFLELKADYAAEAVTGLARLGGVSVGVVAVSGRLTANGAVKINELLNSCEAFGVPVVNLVDCVGVENNLDSENTSLIRETANLLYSYNVMSAAKIALISGSAVGVGYAAFASKSAVDYSVAWADARISTVTDLAAAELLYGGEIAVAEDREKAAERLAARYGEESSGAVVVAQKGFIDNVIEPALTRPYLIAAVRMYLAKR